mmetsp:Transcript_1288/g.4262  ORF Transcript_1288/g.4262 Transcript_1288/m.4262 type:complete len:258 (+) Transcript_1288:1219-1992(+)
MHGLESLHGLSGEQLSLVKLPLQRDPQSKLPGRDAAFLPPVYQVPRKSFPRLTMPEHPIDEHVKTRLPFLCDLGQVTKLKSHPFQDGQPLLGQLPSCSGHTLPLDPHSELLVICIHLRHVAVPIFQQECRKFNCPPVPAIIVARLAQHQFWRPHEHRSHPVLPQRHIALLHEVLGHDLHISRQPRLPPAINQRPSPGSHPPRHRRIHQTLYVLLGNSYIDQIRVQHSLRRSAPRRRLLLTLLLPAIDAPQAILQIFV